MAESLPRRGEGPSGRVQAPHHPPAVPPRALEGIRHSNFIERTFGETRRRVKVIGRLPGERSCLSLVWAVLDRTSRGRRGVDMNPRAVRRLQDLRRELLGPPGREDRQEVIDETVARAA